MTWASEGDDQWTGWRWTKQQYDWKGRPAVTTNQDLSKRTVSYEGCGCAGGEVTTFTDERGRSRRLTKDILRRLSRVDELNWDATQTVYYNLRNPQRYNLYQYVQNDPVNFVAPSGLEDTLVYADPAAFRSKINVVFTA